jgi:hypothetical protein
LRSHTSAASLQQHDAAADQLAEVGNEEEDEWHGVALWLDGLVPGFGARFAPAFAAYDYRSMAVLRAEPPQHLLVAEMLEGTDASLADAAKIMKALEVMARECVDGMVQVAPIPINVHQHNQHHQEGGDDEVHHHDVHTDHHGHDDTGAIDHRQQTLPRDPDTDIQAQSSYNAFFESRFAEDRGGGEG